MALIPPTVDYTDKDFESLRRRAFGLARSVYEDLEDDGAVDWDNFLLELPAWAADIILFYVDRLARESRWGTALSRSALIALAKLVGARPDGTRAAVATIEFTLNAVPAGDFTLPIYQEVRTEGADPIIFQLQEPLFIPAGTDPPTASALGENSLHRDESFASTELPDQRIPVQQDGYVDLTASVNAANGGYEEQSTLFLSGPTDRHFITKLDENDRLTVQFGTGTNGEIPNGTINISYATGGGERGNVDANSIVVIDGSFTDSLGNPVRISLTNPERASGGLDRPSIEALREQIPVDFQSPRVTIGEVDFANNAARVVGIARAMALTQAQDPIIPPARVHLYLVPEAGGQPTQELIDAAIYEVTVVRPTSLELVVEDRPVQYTTIDIRARLFRNAGFSRAVVRANIEEALRIYFAIRNDDGSLNSRVNFGYQLKDEDGLPAPEIPWSRIFETVSAVDGVRKIGDQDGDFLLNGASDDVQISIKGFPALGEIVLIDGSDGVPF